MKLGFIGFGEAGYYFTKDFPKDQVELFAFGHHQDEDNEKGRTLRARAAENNVTLMSSMQDLLDASDIVFNLTTASAALPVAKEVAPLMHKGQTYIDMNSAAPKTKEQIGVAFESSEADFVEAAVMSSVPVGRTHVPVCVCGKTAAAIAEKLNALGANFRYLSEDIGLASASKMLRSIGAKGMIALFAELVFATDRYHLTDEVLSRLNWTMTEEMGFMGFVNYSVASAAIHNGRFVHEMEEVVSMMDDLGENSIMTQAALKKFQWLHDEGYADQFAVRAKTYDEVLEVKHKMENKKGN